MAEQEEGVSVLESRGRRPFLNRLPVPRNAKYSKTIVAAEIGLLHSAAGVPGVRGEQRFDSNQVEAPECLLTDLYLLHECEVSCLEEIPDRRHRPLHAW